MPNESMDPETITRMSAWPAMLFYGVTICLRILSRGDENRDTIRSAWTVAWVLLVAHLMFALLWFHSGSWWAAYEHTAARTIDAVGWDWGGGAWLNLLTAVVWGVDVARLWVRPRVAQTLLHWWDAFTQTYLGFMVFNAAIVFGSETARVGGAVICAGLVIAGIVRLTRRVNA